MQRVRQQGSRRNPVKPLAGAGAYLLASPNLLAAVSAAALIVFAKVPEPGKVKTRLCPPLTPEEAAALYTAMLGDALDQYAALGLPVRLYLGPSEAPLPERLVPPGVTVHAQRGDGLGARMQRAFLETFLAGAQRAVILGTDHPSLPSAFVAFALEAIEHPESIVLGPSDDGGYYLLGMHSFYPALFEGMTYSHAAVFDDTVARAAATDAELTILPPWYDVDDGATLDRLRLDLAADPDGAPRTRAWLRDRATLRNR